MLMFHIKLTVLFEHRNDKNKLVDHKMHTRISGVFVCTHGHQEIWPSYHFADYYQRNVAATTEKLPNFRSLRNPARSVSVP